MLRCTVRETSNFNKSFLLKVSPDLDDQSIDNIVQLSLENNIDGLILTNTTDRNRENLLDEKKMKREDCPVNQYRLYRQAI